MTGVDFTLDRLGTITGTVTDAGKGTPLSGQGVTVHDDLGQPGLPVLTLTDGSYESAGLASGTYFVRTDTSGYQDELFADVGCEPSCDLASGTPIPVALNSTVEGVDLVLAPCPAATNVDLVGTLLHGNRVEEACERLTAGANTIVPATGNVTFKAGRKIVLSDGFLVESGASFRAVIEPAWTSN